MLVNISDHAMGSQDHFRSLRASLTSKRGKSRDKTQARRIKVTLLSPNSLSLSHFS